MTADPTREAVVARAARVSLATACLSAPTIVTGVAGASGATGDCLIR